MTDQDGLEPPIIVLDQVQLIYGKPGTSRSVEALREVSFAVGRQQFVSIVGLSGCGKSTLLKIVSGLLPASGGALRVNGQSPDEARRRRAFGFVFQSPVLLPWRSALENVASTWSGWRGSRSTNRESFPAACSNAWRSRGR
jgi:NitT/TauT family transport system ATP-binding protein